ncbi:hypothetical protein FDP41_007131 [Naegleria fowleri]|uniref:Uncharacterized protein n=1 Tax=Naegleria fowleri TaxID=5763 RepID=A0A6A5BI55_NAEFO|nr:uncharacterized protein FDP41_007131 [Naegleria fowleri]KAF0973744.1 hypothetical protein FDP41_007131 [Naegleria fowleri]CAG4710379.1 unnamed protein product [Naegleria fowleri]
MSSSHSQQQQQQQPPYQSHIGMDPSIYPSTLPTQQPPYPNIPPPPSNNVPFAASHYQPQPPYQTLGDLPTQHYSQQQQSPYVASGVPPPPPPQDQFISAPSPFHSVHVSSSSQHQQEHVSPQQGIDAENPIPVHYHSGQSSQSPQHGFDEPKAPPLRSQEGPSHPQQQQQQHQQQPPPPPQQSPLYPQEQGYHAIYVSDIRTSPNDYVEQSEAAEASSSFSLAICLAFLFGCCGCFPLTCIPFWFTYATYRDSMSPRARSMASLSKSLFWVLVFVNTIFFCISIFVIVIVPPVVVVPRYYYV